MSGHPSKTRTPRDHEVQEALKSSGPIPQHVAIIMDGNGRWARERGLPRVQGHHEGAVSVRAITEASAELGIELLTLYTFSTENWQRPQAEVGALMQLLVRTLRKELRTLDDNKIRLVAIGDLEKLPAAALRELEDVMEATADHDRMTINLALSYSGRWDLTRAMQRIAERVARGDLEAGAVDEATIAAHLTTAGMPEPDLLVRTGGEVRISNFLLWELAYTELYFTDTFWPAFRREALYESIRAFQIRERRFGRVRLNAGQ